MSNQPHHNSPNWGWSQLGYTIERYGRGGRLRRIRNQDGEIVLDNAGHEDECEWLRKHGVIKDEEQLF